MGIDISLTKTYGFSVPLVPLEKKYYDLTDQLEEFADDHNDVITFGTSGSHSMTGAYPRDVFWVGIQRLTDYESPKESDGVVWTFHELPTAEEEEILREVAAKFFPLEEPTFEHIVTLSYS